jgi:hypothetical protein
VIPLVVLLVVINVALIAAACFVIYTALTKLAQWARYDLDASAQTLKMQQIIDQRVQERIAVIQMDSTGNVVSIKKNRPLPAQPVDPNVREVSTIDDLHELEREAQRLMSDTVDYTKRDDFVANQPMMEA